ncbi:MAG TPA: hypothetical protein VFV50_04385 [Bdellovibrionales bacterium]|nr:hypothetical protein [Bdellovibrionales bacterium]
MRFFALVMLVTLISQTSWASLGQRCYRLSQKKSFSARDNSLPLLCVRESGGRFKDSKTRMITVQRRIGKFGTGVGEYVATVKHKPKCRSCNKASYKLMNVISDSPYLTFNGRKSGAGEHGYLVFRGEGYYYSSVR